MNNIFLLHLFGVIYWSEADIFLILVYLGKVNRYKWTFLNIFRAGARGATDCWWWERLCFLFWNVRDNIKCTIQSLHICTAYWISLSMIIVISFQVNLLEAIHTLQIFWSACYLFMIYTIKVKPTIIKSVKELILYSIVYSIKHKISDPKSMQFRKILKKRFLFHLNWHEKKTSTSFEIK